MIKLKKVYKLIRLERLNNLGFDKAVFKMPCDPAVSSFRDSPEKYIKNITCPKTIEPYCTKAIK